MQSRYLVENARDEELVLDGEEGHVAPEGGAVDAGRRAAQRAQRLEADKARVELRPREARLRRERLDVALH